MLRHAEAEGCQEKGLSSKSNVERKELRCGDKEMSSDTVLVTASDWFKASRTQQLPGNYP